MSRVILLLSIASGHAQVTDLLHADFETSLVPAVGSITYNGNRVTAVASLTAVAREPDATLGSQVLALDSSDSSLLNSRFDLSEAADLTGNSVTISFDIAALRTNGSSKTARLSGFDGQNVKIFS